MTTPASTVRVEITDAIATVTLNRPERRNSLGGSLREDLLAAMTQVSADDGVRVIVLTGAGSAFCAGGDLKEMAARVRSGAPRPLLDKVAPLRDRVIRSVYDAPKPVIAAINGPAFGAGLSIALAADVRIASTQAQFAMSFALRGLAPDFGSSFLLPRAVGLSKAMELVFTGASFDATEAQRLQLVSQVVAPDALLPAAMTLARAMSTAAPLPLRLAKRAMQQSHIGGLQEALDRETAGQNICFDTEDGQEGLLAFVENRPPVFHGR